MKDSKKSQAKKKRKNLIKNSTLDLLGKWFEKFFKVV